MRSKAENWPLRTIWSCAYIVLAFAAALFAGCTTSGSIPAPLEPMSPRSFEQYRAETLDWITKRRIFQSATHTDELLRNGPAEWRPTGTESVGKGIVLFHGLGDSPWSFVDIGQALAGQGFLVRTALLPGHGTQPADLIDVDIDDWRRLVAEQVTSLAQEVPQVYLGGFSTGANLALEYALDDAQVEGLVLFSPAIRSKVPVEWVLPWLAKVVTWLRNPHSAQPQQTMVRYLNVPTNGFAQFHRGSAAVREKIARRTFDKPALLVLAQHDSVVDVEYVLQTFQTRFTHPESRLIWYGDLPGRRTVPPRVLVRTDHLPALHISQFSHMGVLFSPSNPFYGEHGVERYCWNGQKEEEQAKCMAGEPVWYSDWGYREPSKVYARLTFNPYFNWQAQVMKAVLEAR